MLRTGLIAGVLALSGFVWSSPPGLADPWKDESGNRQYKYESERGDCKYEYKSGSGGYKEEYKCGPGTGSPVWTAAPVLADPPPWAPAHGYRAKFPDIAGGTCDRGMMSSELVGGALGGALGGLLGSKVGKGSGQLAATAAGALLGAVVGSSIARSMDTIDHDCIRKTLEAAPDHQAVAWRNPDAGAAYTVTPVKTLDDRAGRYCREYITEAVIGGRTEQVYGTACRQPDGSWELVS